MTQVITRYFDDAAQARATRHELVNREGLSSRIVNIYDKADGLAAALGTHVAADTSKTYAKRLAKGGAVIKVEAGFKPLNVARITRDVMAKMGASEITGLVEEVTVKDAVKWPALKSVLTDHPLMMGANGQSEKTDFHMANWPIPLISRRKPFSDSMIGRHTRMAAFPVPLIFNYTPFTGSVIGRHQRMADRGLPLISKREPNTRSIFGRHARMANFPLPLISRRKPFTGSLIGRHAHMASWPFPHLMNGKSVSGLMEGGPHMLPMSKGLLSKRKPNTRSIFGRHARMANFPIPLISGRKPFTGSIIGRHARMADKFLPLVIKGGDEVSSDGASNDGARSFSFSRYLGCRTVIDRKFFTS